MIRSSNKRKYPPPPKKGQLAVDILIYRKEIYTAVER